MTCINLFTYLLFILMSKFTIDFKYLLVDYEINVQ